MNVDFAKMKLGINKVANSQNPKKNEDAR